MSCCREFEDSLWEAAESGAISPELREHLAQCAGCRRSLGALRSAQSGLAALAHVDAPDPRAAVRARIATPPRRSRLIPALAGVMAAACAIVVFVTYQSQPPRPASPDIPVVKTREQTRAAKQERSTVVFPVKTQQPRDKTPVIAQEENTAPKPAPIRHIQRTVPRYRTRTIARIDPMPRVREAESVVGKPVTQVTAVERRHDDMRVRPVPVADPSYRCAALTVAVDAPAPDPRAVHPEVY